MLFVTLVSLVAGVAFAWLMDVAGERGWLSADTLPDGSRYAFSLAALLAAGYSHLFADMLSAPDISTPIEPFWPFFEKPWAVDVA